VVKPGSSGRPDIAAIGGRHEGRRVVGSAMDDYYRTGMYDKMMEGVPQRATSSAVSLRAPLAGWSRRQSRSWSTLSRG
jgi:hypothetical protein